MGRIVTFRAHHDLLERLKIEADTLDEATLKTQHGVYTVLRIYPGRCVLRLDHHLQRMRRSAELLAQPYRVEDFWLRQMLLRAVVEAEQAGIQSPRVRLTIPFDAPDTALLAVEPYNPPAPDVYEQGVRVALANAHRDTPRAKNSMFVERRQQIVAQIRNGFYEVLLCHDDGTILEGVTSNFYAVLGGELRTAEEGMLPGIARSILMEAAPAVIPVSLTPVRVEDITRLSEAMMTSASRGLVPVVRIGEQMVGDGLPGRVFRALRARYDAIVERELEPLETSDK